VFGDTEKIIQSVGQAYGGQVMPFIQCLNKGVPNQTIISLTQKPLTRNLSLEDLEQKHMLVDMNIHQLNRKMRSEVLRFLNEGLENKDWFEVQIRIYDRYSRYMLHLERLLLVLNALDIGIILGEAWSKDSPRFLMSTLVYQLRLFTLLDPVEIKKVLVGLEHLDDGTRIVDLDLMYRNSKIDWPMAQEKRSRVNGRNELGKLYRSRVLKELTVEERAALLEMEKQIIESRY